MPWASSIPLYVHQIFFFFGTAKNLIILEIFIEVLTSSLDQNDVSISLYYILEIRWKMLR